MGLFLKIFIFLNLSAMIICSSVICFPGEDLSTCGQTSTETTMTTRTTTTTTTTTMKKIKLRLRRNCFGEDKENGAFLGECRFRKRCRGGQRSFSKTCGKRLVCCSKTSKNPAIPIVDTRTNLSIPPVQDIESLNLENCGISLTPQLAGGVDAADGEFPFMVSFVQNHSEDGLENFCGGALITFRHVLTAAHCFDRYPLSTWTNSPFIDVRIGLTNILDEELRGAKARIQYIDYHPEFKRRTADSLNPVHDIAIVTLSRRIRNVNVNTACLPTPSHLPVRRPDEHTDLNTILVGWGSNSSKIKDSVEHLQKAYTPIVPVEECQEKYSKWLKGKYRVDIGVNMLCAGDTQIDTCPGDSGAPMLWDVNRSSKTVAGIVSFGPSRCGRGIPGVFTKVEKYLDWIASIIQ